MDGSIFPLRPSCVRFVKLGEGGRWERTCVVERQILCFGFDSANEVQLQHLREGNWAAIRNGWLDVGKGVGFPTYAANALTAYYEDDGTTLWVTFYAGDLYWCFLEPGEPKPLEGDTSGYSYRQVRGAWSRLDSKGKTLNRRTLPGAVNAASRVQSTTHVLTAGERLLERLNGEQSKSVENAEIKRHELTEAVKALIGELNWKDFEVLADLLTTASGWRRTNITGGTEKDLDLDLELPLTGEVAFAQVKAKSSPRELDDYVARAAERPGVKMFYIHNSAKPLITDAPDVYVIGRDQVADLVVKLGYVDWLIEKAR